MGSRSNWGIVARSEAEFNEIVDNLNEQEVRTIVQQLKNTNLFLKVILNKLLSFENLECNLHIPVQCSLR